LREGGGRRGRPEKKERDKEGGVSEKVKPSPPSSVKGKKRMQR